MANITTLTTAQAVSLEHIIQIMRSYGFDHEGQGIRSSNVHIENHESYIVFWLESEQSIANGTLNRNGKGLWWLREEAQQTIHVQ
ncbi:hypothetical protein [Bombiscardovia coagulans]|uniref:Uncharacterized protein n=1 Tax=Bombiscardovia coagulans TaxID=686666 RepID=A0A261ESN1_9BIFI|nr:hypothetical protein [Bombiscardovia coagulans]OZG49867.1 hypothetical protein BOCO_0384 [Bombiscardovia coagulans]